MRILLIKLITPNGLCVERIISQHMDVCNSTTIFYCALIIGKTYKKGFSGNDYHLIKDLDHWNIIDGLITLYYKDGYCLEVSRINEHTQSTIHD